MKKIFAAVLFTLALLLGVPSLAISAEDVTVNMNVVYDQEDARSMLKLINDFRTSKDAWYWEADNINKYYCGQLEPLSYDYELEKVAMKRAAEIALVFSHTRPDGSSWSDAYGEVGYYSFASAENLAAGHSSAKAALEDLREDYAKYGGQGHRRNMLNARYGAVGIACVVCNGIRYYVQEFSDMNRGAARTVVSADEMSVAVRCKSGNLKVLKPVFDRSSSYYHEKYDSVSGQLESYIDGKAGYTVEIPVKGFSVSYSISGDRTFGSPVVAAQSKWKSSDESVAEVVGKSLKLKKCGKTRISTEVCGKKISIDIYVDHDYISTIVPATLQKDGYITKTCKFCGKTDGAGKSTIYSIKTAEVNRNKYPYNKKARKPGITVYDRNGKVIPASSYTLKYSNNKKVGTANITVSFKGNYSGSMSLSFTIVPKTPTITEINTKSNVVVKWKKLASQCDGYQLEYANNPGFTANEGITTISGRTSVSKKMLLTRRGGKRYIRIRAYKTVEGKKYYSDWSDTKVYDY